MAKYTHQQRVEILRICLNLANEKITQASAEDKIKEISSAYPLHTVQVETARIKRYIAGQSTYGYGYAATWAKALLELTNNNSNVVSALHEQQKKYLEKDGKINKTLKVLLDGI